MSRKITLPPPDLNDPTLVSVSPSEAAVLLRLGEHKIYDLIRSGVLPSVRLGPKSIRVPAQALRDLLGVTA